MNRLIFVDSAVFLAAFLLFQIELILSKQLLFAFGGSYTVWGAALVFFQAALLAGYLFSHAAVRIFGVIKYRFIHLCLLGITLFSLPGNSLPVIPAFSSFPLVVTIFMLLVRIIGPAFFVLSTTSVIFQVWVNASESADKLSPYRLYAVSNLGSFAGLVSYPFFFEAFITMKDQVWLWKTGYLVLCFCNLVVFALLRMKPREAKTEPPAPAVPARDKLQWFLLSASGVIMFLSVTNIITVEIAPIPLLWIIPLCLYLISFVLVFKRRPWCPSWICGKFHVIAALSVFVFLVSIQRTVPVVLVVFAHWFLLFQVCMFCQRELYARAPADTRNITVFYVLISAGGFAGGMLVSWIIPLISSLLVEYFTGLFLIALALSLDEKKPGFSRHDFLPVVSFPVLIVVWPVFFPAYNFFGMALLIAALIFIFARLKRHFPAFALCLLAAILFMPFLDIMWTSTYYRYRHRNYYGLYKIFQKNGIRILSNNNTQHGAQFLAREKQAEPILYYHALTPVGKIMSSALFNFDHTGIVGLGAGALASYGKNEQSIDFFELDPDVRRIAREYFTFLDNSSARIQCIIGDARLSLAGVPDRTYDLLVIDAFSGDAVPVHLLTVEAIREYFRCLKDEGILLFHITNRYLDLSPVLFANAGNLGVFSCISSNPREGLAYATTWFAMTRSRDNFLKLSSQLGWAGNSAAGKPRGVRPWVDDYSHVLGTLKIENFLRQMGEFKLFSLSLTTG